MIESPLGGAEGKKLSGRFEGMAHRRRRRRARYEERRGDGSRGEGRDAGRRPISRVGAGKIEDQKG